MGQSIVTPILSTLQGELPLFGQFTQAVEPNGAYLVAAHGVAAAN